VGEGVGAIVASTTRGSSPGRSVGVGAGVALYRDRFSREMMIGRIERLYDEVLQGRAHAN